MSEKDFGGQLMNRPRGRLAAFNSSDVALGLLWALKAGANVTLTMGSDGKLTIASSGGGGGAPTTVDYLVGTADGTLSNEIVVGTSPGGELGGTWASPTVNATHSGSAHHTRSHAIDGASDHTFTNSKRNIWIPASAFIPKVANGVVASASRFDSGSNDITWMGVPFDKDTDQYAAVAPVVFPLNWDASTFTAIIYWTATSGSAGDTVTWGIRGLSLRNDDALNTAQGTAVTVQDAVLAASDVHISAATGAITMAGTLAAGNLNFIEVYRDADGTASTDTLAATAYLMGVQLSIGVDAFSET